MSNIFKSKDPLTESIVAALTTLEEGVAEIADAVKKFKVGDKTNFGVVTAISDKSISFKGKDTGVSKIAFNQRKLGSKDFILDKLQLMEDCSDKEQLDEASISQSTAKLGLKAGVKQDSINRMYKDAFAFFKDAGDSNPADSADKMVEAGFRRLIGSKNFDNKGKKKNESVELDEEQLDEAVKLPIELSGILKKSGFPAATVKSIEDVYNSSYNLFAKVSPQKARQISYDTVKDLINALLEQKKNESVELDEAYQQGSNKFSQIAWGYVASSLAELIKEKDQEVAARRLEDFFARLSDMIGSLADEKQFEKQRKQLQKIEKDLFNASKEINYTLR